MKKPAVRPSDPQLSPLASLLLVVGVAYAAFAVLLALFVGALVVAGSVGLVLLVVALAAAAWGLR